MFGYNATPDVLNENELDVCLYSRIEIIADSIDDLLECQLLAGIEPQHQYQELRNRLLHAILREHLHDRERLHWPCL